MRNLKKFDIEFKLKHKKKHLCAMDETGRGSMASIFVAACVIMPDDFFDEKINDSKKLSESSIISLSEKIKNHAIFYKRERENPIPLWVGMKATLQIK